jgi:hypothetical protein
VAEHVHDGHEETLLEWPDHHRVSTEVFAPARPDQARVFQEFVHV